MICNGIYVLEANGNEFCPFIKFRPRQFQWMDIANERQSTEIDIGQSVQCFIKIAEISKPLNEMAANSKNDDSVSQRQIASVVVAITDPHKPGASFIRIPSEHQCILIKVQVLCSDCAPRNYNIQINWQGRDVNELDRPGKLSVSLVDDPVSIKQSAYTERR